ncbi:hypothetical protein [Mycolicibacterium sp. NCC-Tsukiji]|uniref:hypothetical protein n=1 Tax=Mycolicibacterium sp. NCC-Tsukiji TaxID=2185272 RepID=UPI000EE6C694|nr:hypothetical protein [Mycolicibacterium sp. NCC-Tsukiji]GCB01341.1 hypothetical protein NCCNTM_49750 [Mycolicibacterium sp. NCC-Tsukiji]
MRFDEFIHSSGITAVPVERFPGLVVEVGLPVGWYPFEGDVGVRVWACRSDPCIDVFCANAVLTMHRIETRLDAADAFAMLVEQQLQTVAGTRELTRALSAATEGPGAMGLLRMEITDGVGVIESLTRSRIVAVEGETMVSQLTTTALRDSPANRAAVWMTLRSGDASGSHRGGAPITGTRDRH